MKEDGLVEVRNHRPTLDYRTVYNFSPSPSSFIYDRSLFDVSTIQLYFNHNLLDRPVSLMTGHFRFGLIN